MKELLGKVNNPTGLTSRLCAELVAEANRASKCHLLLSAHGEEADLKSIMNMMALVIRHNEDFSIQITGDNEEEVYQKFDKLLDELNLK